MKSGYYNTANCLNNERKDSNTNIHIHEKCKGIKYNNVKTHDKHNFKIIKIGNNDKDKKNQWAFSHLFTLIRELFSSLKPLLTYNHDGRL